MLWLLDHFLSLIFPLKFFQILRCNFIFSKHRAVFTVSCSTVIWFTNVLYKNSLLTSLIFWSLKYLMTYCTQDHLTADALVSGPDLVPQKMIFSQKFTKKCAKYKHSVLRLITIFVFHQILTKLLFSFETFWGVFKSNFFSNTKAIKTPFY